MDEKEFLIFIDKKLKEILEDKEEEIENIKQLEVFQ